MNSPNVIKIIRIDRDGDMEGISPTELIEFEKQRCLAFDESIKLISTLRTRINELETELASYRNDAKIKKLEAELAPYRKLRDEVKKQGETPWVSYAKKQKSMP